MQPPRYHPVSIALHWIVVILVFAQLALGWWMIDIPKNPPGPRASWFNVHKSIGLTIGVLMLARLGWRLRHPAPPLPAPMPSWQKTAAHTSHFLLYACVILQPLWGYLGSSFTRYPIRYFGVSLPHWGWDSPALKDLFSALHLGTAYVLMTVLVVHVAAALKHLVVDRDGVFQRMWPRGGAARST
jgi:cytochrome b561